MFYSLPLKAVSTGLSLKDLILKIDKIFNLDLGGNWEDIKNNICQLMKLTGPTFIYKTERGYEFKDNSPTFSTATFNTLLIQSYITFLKILITSKSQNWFFKQ